MNDQGSKQVRLEAMAEAALGGHDLMEWKRTESGYQALCSLCLMTVWVGDKGVSYSLLEDTCPGGEPD